MPGRLTHASHSQILIEIHRVQPNTFLTPIVHFCISVSSLRGDFFSYFCKLMHYEESEVVSHCTSYLSASESQQESKSIHACPRLCICFG